MLSSISANLLNDRFTVPSGVAWMQEFAWGPPSGTTLSKLDIRQQATSGLVAWRIATVQGDGLLTSLNLSIQNATGIGVPIVITTTVAHNIPSGSSRPVIISGALGNTTINGSRIATAVNTTDLSLTSSTGAALTGNGNYLAGGTVIYGGTFKFIELAAGSPYTIDSIMMRDFTLYITANASASTVFVITYGR